VAAEAVCFPRNTVESSPYSCATLVRQQNLLLFCKILKPEIINLPKHLGKTLKLITNNIFDIDIKFFFGIVS
jgi:hypothetical protein